MPRDPQVGIRLRSATTTNLAAVLTWLKAEWDGYMGFWGNRKMIEEGQVEGDLTVAVDAASKTVVGFLLSGDASLDILEVRADFRGKGVGRMLAQHGLDRIEAAGGLGVVIECQPVRSMPFWRRLGFRSLPMGTRGGEERHLVYLFPKRLVLPADAPRMEVHVALRPESDREPVQQFSSIAAVVDGTAFLEERIAAFVHDGDTLITVRAGDQKFPEKKVKYAQKMGLVYQEGFIRLDALKLNPNSE